MERNQITHVDQLPKHLQHNGNWIADAIKGVDSDNSGGLMIDNELKLFDIYHCTLNTFSEEENQPRDFVCSLYAHSMEDVFKLGQHESNCFEYTSLKVRSINIGDVIADDEGFYMVCKHGFKLIMLKENESAD